MLRSVLLTFVFCLLASAAGAGEGPSSWMPTQADARRAIANNPEPPSRLTPLQSLPSLPLTQQNVGTIRSVRVKDGQKVVALTFDLCELASVTTGCDMGILGFLRRENVAATLFMGGKWMRTHADRVRLLLQQTDIFEIGNHAWTHGNFALLDDNGMREQVLWTQAQYELLAESAGIQYGKQSAFGVPRLFRLPYGRCNERALRQLASLGMRVIQWNVVAESGSDNTNLKIARQEAQRVASQISPGAIVLFHANLVPKGSANLLREFVSILRHEGYSFVKVSALLDMGTPEMTMDGYFERPGDNHALDGKFGKNGTGLSN